jgi:hypothetical protein
MGAKADSILPRKVSVGTIAKKRGVPIVRELGDLGFSAVVGPMLGTRLSAKQSPQIGDDPELIPQGRQDAV